MALTPSPVRTHPLLAELPSPICVNDINGCDCPYVVKGIMKYCAEAEK